MSHTKVVSTSGRDVGSVQAFAPHLQYPPFAGSRPLAPQMSQTSEGSMRPTNDRSVHALPPQPQGLSASWIDRKRPHDSHFNIRLCSEARRLRQQGRRGPARRTTVASPAKAASGDRAGAPESWPRGRGRSRSGSSGRRRGHHGPSREPHRARMVRHVTMRARLAMPGPLRTRSAHGVRMRRAPRARRAHRRAVRLSAVASAGDGPPPGEPPAATSAPHSGCLSSARVWISRALPTDVVHVDDTLERAVEATP
jgi:hypothetical protein